MLAGDCYGERPEEILDVIRAKKQAKAAYLCRKMRCEPDSIVLEIGSGMGLSSKHIARQVKHLYCSDVSASFLEAARKECADIPWYFSEFQRLVKKRGKVFINIMNGAAIDPRKLLQMADLYRKSKANLPRLLCWNSPDAVLDYYRGRQRVAIPDGARQRDLAAE